MAGVCLFVCLSVCLSAAALRKNYWFCNFCMYVYGLITWASSKRPGVYWKPAFIRDPSFIRSFPGYKLKVYAS